MSGHRSHTTLAQSHDAKRAVRSPSAPAPVGPYSPAIRTHDLVFVSGQDPIDPNRGAARIVVFLDGTIADPAQPYLRVDDLGLLRGDGVFETILVIDGHARELQTHLDRLARSATMLDLPQPDLAGFERATRTVIAHWPSTSEIAVKLVHTRGVDGAPVRQSTGFALGMDVDPNEIHARTHGISAVTLERGIDPMVAERAPWLLLGAKSLSYAINMAALREATRRGADEAIFTTNDNLVLEGPTSTVVVAKHATLYTPPPSLGVLPGTTQGALFRAAEDAGWATTTRELRTADLYDADGLFLTSSGHTLVRVHTLNNQTLADSRTLHTQLSAAYEAEYTRNL